MKIDYYENNCSLVAFQHILPDRDETEIIAACMKAGFTEHFGMLPFQIETAATLLGLKYTVGDSIRKKSANDFRDNMTVNQVLQATTNEVCMIRVVGHVFASNHGIPLDTNHRIRGARRRVLGFYVMHNATLTRRNAPAITSNPRIQFVHDITHNTRKQSQRREIFEAVAKHAGDNAVLFDDLRKHGYTRRMLRKHVERGDAVILD